MSCAMRSVMRSQTRPRQTRLRPILNQNHLHPCRNCNPKSQNRRRRCRGQTWRNSHKGARDAEEVTEAETMETAKETEQAAATGAAEVQDAQ